jgi:hypothetical protein
MQVTWKIAKTSFFALATVVLALLTTPPTVLDALFADWLRASGMDSPPSALATWVASNFAFLFAIYVFVLLIVALAEWSWEKLKKPSAVSDKEKWRKLARDINVDLSKFESKDSSSERSIVLLEMGPKFKADVAEALSKIKALGITVPTDVSPHTINQFCWQKIAGFLLDAANKQEK